MGRSETGEGPIGRILAQLPATRSAWLVLGVRLGLIAALLLELYVTAHRQRPDLLDPTAIGSDPSTYYAAGLRLNDGHNLYGPLLAGDRPVPGYPGSLPAPLLSPPLVAVAMRLPAALLGDASMTAVWSGSIALIVVFTVWFALRGRPPQLATLAVVLALGLPMTLSVGVAYRYLGQNSPVSFAALSGNLNAYLLGLFVLVWWAASNGHDRVAGVAAALATALKLGPIVLLWWFVVRRRWQSVIAFVAGLAVFGVVGLVFAGVGASLDYAHLALGGGIQPQGFAVADILSGLLRLQLASTGGSTYVVVGLGVMAIAALRDRPRAAFAVAIATTIYSSPVVLAGNLALFLAIAAPWVIDGATARLGSDAPRRAMWDRLLARAPRSPA